MLFSLPSSFSFGSKSFLHLVLVLTQLWSSSSDVGMKNLANSLTPEGPMCLWGSSWMSCNLSVSESLLLWRALAFSACTCFLVPMSLGHLRGYREVAHLQLEVLRQALVASMAAWQLASVWWYAAVGLSSCPFDSSLWHALLISGTCEQGVERALHLKQFWWHRLMCWLNCLSLGLRCLKMAVSCS